MAEPQLLTVADPANRWKTLLASKTFLFWSFYSFLSLVVIGFDLSLPGEMLAMPAFTCQFGRPFAGAYVVPALWQSLWNGMSQLGQCLGALASTPVSNRWGRKPSYITACCICIAGIGCQFGAREWKVMLAGKLVNGFGLGMCFVFAPLYVGENCFPELRGFFLVFLNWSICYGQFFSGLTARWAEMLPGNACWLVAIAMQWIFPVITLALMPFFPESPYFLLARRDDLARARAALQRLYGRRNEALVARRLRELQLEVRLHSSMAGVTWRTCLKGANRARTSLTFWTGATQQFIGTSFIMAYFSYFVSLFGVSKPFDMNIIFYLAGILGNSVAFYGVERVGRRQLIVHGLLVMWLMLLLIGGLAFANHGAARADHTLPNTLVALFIVWGWIYNVTLGAGGLVLSSEVSDLALRAYTQPLVTIANAGLGWVTNFVSPYLINPDEANLGAKVGLIFGGLGFVCWIWAYFYVPETKDMTYAELAWLFEESGASRRRFPEAIARRKRELVGEGANGAGLGSVVEVEGDKAVAVHAEDIDVPPAAVVAAEVGPV